MDDLTRRSLIGLVQFQLVLAALLFLPAWSLTYWQGWLYWFVFGAACLVLGLYFARHDPALVERRMKAGPTAETEPRQKIVLWCASASLIAIYLVCGFDHRFGWSFVPWPLVLVANALVLLGFYGFYIVFRENTFAATTVTVESGQRVISSGPYGLVRHPMYTAAVVMFLATPVALGSWWGLVPAAALAATIVWRLLDEEQYLMRNLTGYIEYQSAVRTRLVPGVW
jgi:protein-S-isoprenylcysteine O-methyltransferase Ste14